MAECAIPVGSFSRGSGFSEFLHSLFRRNSGIMRCRFNQSILNQTLAPASALYNQNFLTTVGNGLDRLPLPLAKPRPGIADRGTQQFFRFLLVHFSRLNGKPTIRRRQREDGRGRRGAGSG